jgi:protease-4
MSYLDAVEQNKKEGYTYNQLSAGKFKDTGDPDRPLSAEEVKLIMRDVNIMHRNFIRAVSENRKIDVEKVDSLADGSSMLGEAALYNGLIDQIGGIQDVESYLKEKIGEDATLCW